MKEGDMEALGNRVKGGREGKKHTSTLIFWSKLLTSSIPRPLLCFTLLHLPTKKKGSSSEEGKLNESGGGEAKDRMYTRGGSGKKRRERKGRGRGEVG